MKTFTTRLDEPTLESLKMAVIARLAIEEKELADSPLGTIHEISRHIDKHEGRVWGVKKSLEIIREFIEESHKQQKEEE